ncbi:hypothetical protein CTA2_9147, partial [Colletotrichum tanaceti]
GECHSSWRQFGTSTGRCINCTTGRIRFLPFPPAPAFSQPPPGSPFCRTIRVRKRPRSNMSNFGNFMKNGWHPEKAGTTLKGQVNGLLGRNKDDEKEDRVARPLSSLQDPSTFAPPPRRVPGAPPPRSNATSPGAPPPPYEDPSRQQQQQQQEEEEEAPPRPYRVNTTGLSTSHLPPPPGRK